MYDMSLDDWNPLFLLIRQNDWAEALSLLKTSSYHAKSSIQITGFASAKVVSKVNAMQLACCFPFVPKTFLEALHKANNKLVKAVDEDDGRTCLHIATAHGVATEAIYALLQAQPSAAQQTDKQGRLPLHYACKYHHPHPTRNHYDEADSDAGILDLIRLLLKFHPQGSSTPDSMGYLPLHYCCIPNVSASSLTSKSSPSRQQQYPPTSVIRVLIRSAPDSLMRCNNDGHTPIHLARDSAGPEITGFLIRFSGESSSRQIKTKNKKRTMTGKESSNSSGSSSSSSSLSARVQPLHSDDNGVNDDDDDDVQTLASTKSTSEQSILTTTSSNAGSCGVRVITKQGSRGNLLNRFLLIRKK